MDFQCIARIFKYFLYLKFLAVVLCYEKYQQQTLMNAANRYPKYIMSSILIAECERFCKLQSYNCLFSFLAVTAIMNSFNWPCSAFSVNNNKVIGFTESLVKYVKPVNRVKGSKNGCQQNHSCCYGGSGC